MIQYSDRLTEDRVRNEKLYINEINWTPNQYIGYLNLYIKTAKRAAPNP